MTKGEALALLFNGIQTQIFNTFSLYGYRRVDNQIYFIIEDELNMTDKWIKEKHVSSINCLMQFELDEKNWYVWEPENK